MDEKNVHCDIFYQEGRTDIFDPDNEGAWDSFLVLEDNSSNEEMYRSDSQIAKEAKGITTVSELEGCGEENDNLPHENELSLSCPLPSIAKRTAVKYPMFGSESKLNKLYSHDRAQKVSKKLDNRSKTITPFDASMTIEEHPENVDDPIKKKPGNDQQKMEKRPLDNSKHHEKTNTDTESAPNSPNGPSEYFDQANPDTSPSPSPLRSEDIKDNRNINGMFGNIPFRKDIASGLQKKIAEMIKDIDNTSSKIDDVIDPDDMDFITPFLQEHGNNNTNRTFEMKLFRESVPGFSHMRRKNDESLQTLMKTCQDMIKSNIKVIKQVHEEKIQTQEVLDECKNSNFELKQQVDEDKEQFQLETKRFKNIEQSYETKIHDLSNVIDELKGEISDQKRQLAERSDIINSLTDHVTEIITEFGKLMKINADALLNERKLQKKCENLLQSLLDKSTNKNCNEMSFLI